MHPTIKKNKNSLYDACCDIDSPKVLTFKDVTDAYERIKNGIKRTPLCVSDHFSKSTDAIIYLKKEFTQFTRSFKERGARNALLRLTEREAKSGVFAASAGNHGLAMSYHGKCLNIPVHIYMPVFAPLIKVDNCRKLGANVVLIGDSLTEARDAALRAAFRSGGKYINGYDHIDILAGAGTVGLEVIEDLPDIDVIIVPIGGGGLISGVAVALKTLKPTIKIIGVQATACPAFHVSLKSGKYTPVLCKPTIADGLAVAKIGVNSFETSKKLIDYSFCIEEEDIAMGVFRLLEWERLICEGAGAISIAALFNKEVLDLIKGKKVVCLLTGGNIDITKLTACIDKGLALDRRLIRFNVIILERPQALAQLINIISNVGATVKDIRHERAFEKQGTLHTRVRVTCETIGADHADSLECEMKKIYKSAYFYPAQDNYERKSY
uniref:Serine racemase n=1 Tax=Parastrongyloides trichosuri TaxID=131310 RepID=A0A0N4ZNK3_PARTI